jgi:23S rRNA maturation mini-RNase III
MPSHAQQSAPIPQYREMRDRSAYLHRLARECAAKAAAATDAVMRARFEQEEQEWLARAREAAQDEREHREL